jgi:hypothetical protein
MKHIQPLSKIALPSPACTYTGPHFAIYLGAKLGVPSIGGIVGFLLSVFNNPCAGWPSDPE